MLKVIFLLTIHADYLRPSTNVNRNRQSLTKKIVNPSISVRFDRTIIARVISISA
jgi:hypothetical protein